MGWGRQGVDSDPGVSQVQSGERDVIGWLGVRLLAQAGGWSLGTAGTCNHVLFLWKKVSLICTHAITLFSFSSSQDGRNHAK